MISISVWSVYCFPISKISPTALKSFKWFNYLSFNIRLRCTNYTIYQMRILYAQVQGPDNIYVYDFFDIKILETLFTADVHVKRTVITLWLNFVLRSRQRSHYKVNLLGLKETLSFVCNRLKSNWIINIWAFSDFVKKVPPVQYIYIHCIHCSINKA